MGKVLGVILFIIGIILITMGVLGAINLATPMANTSWIGSLLGVILALGGGLALMLAGLNALVPNKPLLKYFAIEGPSGTAYGAIQE